ncbi:MAG: hypothetical protein M3279_12650 [Actinomycetota bacterium]|nr:hypothetical protein [Actinomycetota bacterium]
MQGQLFPDNKPQLEPVISFQARASKQGRIVREFAQDALAGAGFSLSSARFEVSMTGVEVDVAAADKLGNRWYCEVTGAYGSRRPGLARTDTVRKILASAYMLADWSIGPFVVITTDLPAPGSRGDVWLRHAGPDVIYDVLVLGRGDDFRRLEAYATRGPSGGPLPGWWRPEELGGRRDQHQPPLPFVELDGADDVAGFDRLRHYIKIVMPSRNSIGYPIDPVVLATFQKDLVAWLMNRNGGQVKQTAEGSWLDPNGAPMDERISILGSWGRTPVSRSEIQPFVDRMFDELDQLAVSVFIDGEMLLFSRVGAEA